MKDDASSEPLYEALPVAPGESDFKIKGLAYRGIVEFMKSQGSSFQRAVIESLPPDLQQFCSQPFLAASWYDALPIPWFTAAVARQLGVPHADYLSAGGAKQAAHDARTVYRHLIEDRSPFEVVRRQVTIGMRYYSFLEGECVLVGDREGNVIARGMPRYLTPWFMPMQESYTREILRRSGATHPVVRAELVHGGGASGAPLEPTELVFRASWGP